MLKCVKNIKVKSLNLYKLLITTNNFTSISKMGRDENMEAELLQEARDIVPPLLMDMYKGQAGRIGVIGGSMEYTGAPYFSAISALKVGCDLAHVFCARAAAPVIKSYSPELIVHPVLDADNALELVKPWLSRLHTLVIGPGLGREPTILNTVAQIIKLCRGPEYAKPIVVDADGLFLLTEQPDLIKDFPSGAILTPNAIEFSRLAKSVLDESWSASPSPSPEKVMALAMELGTNIVVVHKGASDVIAEGGCKDVVFCSESGSGRRCGGQGDLLSGSLGTFYAWAIKAQEALSEGTCSLLPPGMVAAYASCRLTRLCNARAFAKAGRSMVTTNMIEEIHHAFEELFEQ